ncbi:hypothetical protein S23_28150 [Bradyrhizobium cosmicum]|uniref:Uncharacterized protein n=1 Tax=Bradyrhizobium cosmicum TaxID=1404864 RepID=A0AAI8QB78_9BRAD|nr:hypothetical protein S23_28150 [Bradyrhizobium cosmicum]
MQRYAGMHADVADPDVLEIDVPGLLMGIVAAAAGEGGHGYPYAARTAREQLILFLVLAKPLSFAVCADFAEQSKRRKTL